VSHKKESVNRKLCKAFEWSYADNGVDQMKNSSTEFIADGAASGKNPKLKRA
jgi:hypothetical protein